MWWAGVVWLICACAELAAATFSAGVGIADVTGPPAEINFMGYANLKQAGAGIHLRQFSRAFVLEQASTRLVFVSVDAAMMGIGVRREVIRKLQKRYGRTYNESNVILSGTHTHSTPGGFLMDFLFDLPILGFVQETFNAYVSGITKSIIIAHESMAPARMYYGETELLEANINRSPTAYLHNPQQERDRYEYDVDKRMSQIRIVRISDSSPMGVINWFPVHPTSMNNTNQLISSDNVGYASILMEKELNPPGTFPGRGKVVCAFASTNLGDVSPNTRGPRCEFSGKICDNEQRLCQPDERCFASGPGKNMFQSTKIIASKLFGAAMSLYRSPGEELQGSLSIVHQYVDMPSQKVNPYDPVANAFNTSSTVSGCLPAMGYSFAAGTTDGPGAFNFTQGDKTGNPLWNAVRDFIAEPTPEDIECQKPKPILLATGRIKFPYSWQPTVVSCSVAWLGGVLLAAVPGEFTTMSGRRLKQVLATRAAQYGHRPHVVLAGLSNIYSDYIATPEEYQAQRYEGASTIFGPHTLDIYLNKYDKLTGALFEGRTVQPGPQPLDHSNAVISLVAPVLWDAAPWGKEFGDCIKQPERTYKRGETVRATFVSGHPRNNLRHGRWYAVVEQLVSPEDEVWTIVATDADWETKFIWQRSSTILGTSYADLIWEIPKSTEPGTYRLHHYGHYKYILGGIYPYDGFTDSFQMIYRRYC